MFDEDQIIDSYQNVVCSPAGNESVEAITGGREALQHVAHVGGYMEVADIYLERGERSENDEDAERIAGEPSSDREEGDPQRRPPTGHGSGDRNEPGHAHQEGGPSGDDESERGRASSGESFEDEADNALFRPHRP